LPAGIIGGISLARGGGSFGGGRGGGSFGGRSGGSFGGSRGGGSIGRSGGLFGGSSTRSGSTGTGSSFRPVFSPITPMGGGGGFGHRRSSGGGGCGCISILVLILVIAIVFIVIFSIWGAVNSDAGSKITLSSVERVPLPPGSVNETGYYTDELGWITNESKLIEGLKYFYKETGVQPYLYLTDTIKGSNFPTESDLESYANELYDDLFRDEAHLLLLFFEYDGDYRGWYIVGTQAKSVIDDEAGRILTDYIDRYYYDTNLTNEEFFSKAFKDGADRIMTVTRSPWITVFKVFGVIILVIVLFVWWKKHKEQKNLEAKRREELLKTPLDRFGDKEAEDLMKKYQDDNEK
jgi:uncharacterized membrane protein